MNWQWRKLVRNPLVKDHPLPNIHLLPTATIQPNVGHTNHHDVWLLHSQHFEHALDCVGSFAGAYSGIYGYIDGVEQRRYLGAEVLIDQRLCSDGGVVAGCGGMRVFGLVAIDLFVVIYLITIQ